MKKYFFFLMIFLLSFKIDAQILFDAQSRGNDPRVPAVVDSNFIKLTIYNTYPPRIYKGLKNRIGVSCGNIKQNELLIGQQEFLGEKEDRIRWRSSKYGQWVNEISVENDWGDAERWVDNDSLKWMRIYNLIPNSLDSIRLSCYYSLSEVDSIEIGTVLVPVYELPKPQLNLSDKNIYPMEIEKEKLLQLENIEATSDLIFPEQDSYCKIRYFEFVLKKKRKKEIVIPWYDNALSRDMKELIFTSKKGTQIIFRNIKSDKVTFEKLSFKLK